MSTKEGKKNRKQGRNIASCLRYKNQGRREINKARKAKRHAKRHPNDNNQ